MAEGSIFKDAVMFVNIKIHPFVVKGRLPTYAP